MIGKYLDVSTSHLSVETVDILEAGRIEEIVSYNYPEGMFIPVMDKDSEPHNIPADLKILLEWAREKGITLIRLDRDGEEIDEIPTYDWSESTHTWLIGISSSATSGTHFYKFFETIKDIKHYLLESVNEDRNNDKENWDFGTENISEIAYLDNELYAFGCYHDYHIDYTAIKMENLEEV